MSRCSLAILMLLVATASSRAQTPLTTAVFEPSPDHHRTVGSAAILTEYVLEVALVSTPTVVAASQTLGKPTPDAQGEIRADVRVLLGSLSPGEYIGRVLAVGPAGRSAPSTSDPFVISLPVPAPAGKPSIR